MTFRPSHWRAEKSEEINRHIGDTRGGAKIAPCPNNCSPSSTNSRWCFGASKSRVCNAWSGSGAKAQSDLASGFPPGVHFFANRGVAPRNSLDGKW
jgi:hypothetical protein